MHDRLTMIESATKNLTVNVIVLFLTIIFCHTYHISLIYSFGTIRPGRGGGRLLRNYRGIRIYKLLTGKNFQIGVVCPRGEGVLTGLIIGKAVNHVLGIVF